MYTRAVSIKVNDRLLGGLTSISVPAQRNMIGASEEYIERPLFQGKVLVNIFNQVRLLLRTLTRGTFSVLATMLTSGSFWSFIYVLSAIEHRGNPSSTFLSRDRGKYMGY